jgi:hypothetical protein
LKNRAPRPKNARAGGSSIVACALRAQGRMTIRTTRSCGSLLVIAGLVIPLATSCAGRRETVVTRNVTIEERTVPPPKMIDIAIVDLHDEPALDPDQEKVVGTIINEGDKRVSGFSIRVNALDSSGNVVRTITTPPLAETIAPSGGRTRFEAYMPRDPAVTGYHAVAIAR